MTTLDDRITFTVSGQDVSEHDEGIYTYVLYENVLGTDKRIFTGNFYHNGIDSAVTFDVTDIIASNVSMLGEDEFSNGAVRSISTNIVDRYYMVIDWGDVHPSSTSNKWVGKIYSYPNKRLYESSMLFNPDVAAFSDKKVVLQQGYNQSASMDSILIPHYPMFNDEQAQSTCVCPFGLSFLVGTSGTPLTLNFSVDGTAYGESASFNQDYTVNHNTYSFSYVGQVQGIGTYLDIVPESDGVLGLEYSASSTSFNVLKITDVMTTWKTDLYRRYAEGDTTGTYKYAFVFVNNSTNKNASDTSVDITDIDTSKIIYADTVTPDVSDYLFNGSDEYVVNQKATRTVNVKVYKKVAIFDICPKKYYLFWKDRLGSYQCQGFNNFANYSESFDRTEVQDYRNRRRNANIQVQSKWSLFSGWIPEDMYPYYESIYVSPILMLYDKDLNKTFSVMVSGDYVEKTYRNQKKMININLELEENKKQNITY